MAAGAALIIPPPAVLVTAFLTGSDSLGKVFLLIIPWYFIAWIAAGAQMFANWHDNRARGQLPPRRGQRGQALQRERYGGIDGDLMPCEARRNTKRASAALA